MRLGRARISRSVTEAGLKGGGLPRQGGMKGGRGRGEKEWREPTKGLTAFVPDLTYLTLGKGRVLRKET